MAYDPQVVLRRDRWMCRLRFAGCQRKATTTVTHTPGWLGGEATLSNARAACTSCAKQHHRQRKWAEALFEGVQS